MGGLNFKERRERERNLICISSSVVVPSLRYGFFSFVRFTRATIFTRIPYYPCGIVQHIKDINIKK